jgi:hypothetical protein
MDQEIAVLTRMARDLETLSPLAQRRVLDYLVNRRMTTDHTPVSVPSDGEVLDDPAAKVRRWAE